MKKFNNFLLLILLPFASYSATIPAPQSNGQQFKIYESRIGNLCVYGGASASGWFLYPSLDHVGSIQCISAPNFIFDTLGRIAAQIRGNWWCLQAPNSASVQTSYDYVTLEPCVINEPRQYWLSKEDGKIFTAVGNYQLGEINWTLAIARDKSKIYQFSLSLDNPTKWLTENAKAMAGLVLKIPMYWIYKDGSRYDLTPNNYGSDIYYNSENGHIYYRKNSDSMLCLRSKQVAFTPDADWNWTDWTPCSTKSGDRELVWRLSSLLQNNTNPLQYPFLGTDADGNLLRINQTGSNWGNFYTIKQDKLNKYTKDTPLSIFLTDINLKTYSRLQNANLRKVLANCPAPGKSPNTQNPIINSKALPSSFVLSEDWINWLYRIAKTQGSYQLSIGVCGPCFVQTLESLLSLYRSPFEPPSRETGILFDHRSSDILLSLRGRLTSLSTNTLERDTRTLQALYQVETDPNKQRLLRAQQLLSGIKILTPELNVENNLNWSIRNSGALSEYKELLNTMLTAPAGSTWLLHYEFKYNDGSMGGHVMLAIRDASGLRVVPENVGRDFTLDQFKVSATTFINNTSKLYTTLKTQGGTTRNIDSIQRVGVIQVTLPTHFVHNTTISVGSCEKQDPFTEGYGSGLALTGAEVNQCGATGGKCDQVNPISR